MSADVRTDAAKLIRRLKKEGMSISFAESCTGGLLASTMTDNAGASEWFNMSFITYSNQAKMQILGVEESALDKNGAVSAVVAEQMAAGARDVAKSHVAISITGIAGPTAAGTKKGIGTVFVGIAIGNRTFANSTELGGNRSENKSGFVHFAIQTALECWDKIGDLDNYVTEKEEKHSREQIVEREKYFSQRKQNKAKVENEDWQGTDDWNEEETIVEKLKDAENSKSDDLADNVEW